MKSSVEIAQEASLKPITEIAAMLGLEADELEPYGKYKAKILPQAFQRRKDRPDGKLIVVTATTPTPAGEGKTTTAIGLAQALWRLGKKSAVCIREPSLGPVFGVKGGAAGGGYAQVLPMEDINLHFTGDIHAVSAAHNLLAALIDNHLYQGNELNIDPQRIVWKRVVDMNDRALRQITLALGGGSGVETRPSGFEITAASEVMAALCLASDLEDLKSRLGRLIVAYNRDGAPVYASQLKAQGAMSILLKDAVKPNLVQTIENTPAIIHGGPFANIAHGCPSVIAIRLALKLADYVVVEPGFGSDLGAEKFFNIVCRLAGFTPSVAVLVTTVRALKLQGGAPKERLSEENLDALGRGTENLDKHIENVKRFGLPLVVALNHHPTDTEAEISLLTSHCERRGVPVALSRVFAEGGSGGVELARKVEEAIDTSNASLSFAYDEGMDVKSKIAAIAREIYGAAEVSFSEKAEESIRLINEMNYGSLPICIAKTPLSLSDEPSLLGRPRGFKFKVRDLKVSAAAGFLVVYAGDIMTMPGLPKKPAAENMDIDSGGRISGLF